VAEYQCVRVALDDANGVRERLPFETDEESTSPMPIVFIPRRLAALSKLIRVRVLGSKKQSASTLPACRSA